MSGKESVKTPPRLAKNFFTRLYFLLLFARMLFDFKIIIRRNIMNIGSLIITIILSIIGVGSSLVIIGYMLLIIAQKIYRKIAHGASLYD